MSMKSYFHSTTSPGPLLFQGFPVSDGTQYMTACGILVAFCLLKEWLFAFRTSSSDSFLNGVFSKSRQQNEQIRSSILYGFNLALGYIVMLVVMSFNIGYFIVIVLASSLGHYLFHQKPESISSLEDVDCCER